MTGFDELLHLQEHDTTIDQLEHKLATLPEREQVVANQRAVAALAQEQAGVQSQRDEVAREQKRIEDEVAIVETKAAEVHTKLYSGTVTSPKELQALQADFDSLKRRQRELEDKVIEDMEAAEPLDVLLEQHTAAATALLAEGEAIAAALAAAEIAVGAELDQARAERDQIVANVPAELVQAYDKLRPQYQGIAVARLVGTNCSGCHLTLSSMALDNLHRMPPDALATCDECGRILVR